MPRHDWFNDDTMSRDRDEWRDPRLEGRRYSGDSGAFFDSDRNDRFRSHGDYGRDRRDFDSDRNRPIGGWGGLMGEDMERERFRDRDRMSGRDRGRDRMRAESRRDEHFGPDDYNRGVPMDETEQLIASNKVEGTPVYDRHGEKLGSIHNFMVHKTRGQVVYAVLKHGGGFLGLGERYYPLEWNQLTYDTRLGGYHTDLDEEDLQSFGSFDSEGRWQRRRSPGRERTRGNRFDDGRGRRNMGGW